MKMKKIIYTLLGMMLSVGAWADNVAKIGTTEYATLAEAFESITDNTATTIELLADCSGNGIIVPSNRTITVNFNTHKYTVNTDVLAGSNGTKNQCFQLLRDSKVTFNNGSIVADNAAIKMIIQNYCDLTLTGMTIDATQGTNSVNYVVSNNNGNSVFGAGTTITAKDTGVAFDVYSFKNEFNYTGANVTVDGATINGKIEVSAKNDGSDVSTLGLNLKSGTINGSIVLGSRADEATITKSESVNVDAPAGYKWDSTGKLVAIEYTAQIGDVKYESLSDAIAAATDGQTIVMLADVNGASTDIPAGKRIVLDLNGKVLTSESKVFVVAGDLTIEDNSAKKTGKIVSTKDSGIGINKTSDGAKVTFNSGAIEAVEGCIITSTATGATIIINGGTFTCSDNAVIAGNGSASYKDTSTPRVNPNTITINGGTFNGQITSAGYVACGIYAPWKDVITVNGGTFNITGGCGVLARAGSVVINGGTFATTGNVTGKVGDSRVVVPCSAIVYDSEAGYPAMTAESKIEVPSASTATFKSDAGVNAVSVVGGSHIEISGGTYSSPLTEDVCAAGYVPSNTPNADGTYGATFGTYVAKIGDVKYTSLQEALAAASADATITLLADIAVDQTILIDKNLTIDGGNHTITSSVTNKLGAFYVNTPTCNFTIQNATMDGKNVASMAVVSYRGVANDALDGIVSTDNNNDGNNITLTDCTVQNFTGWPGSYVGAVYAFSHSHLTLNNCTFTGNTTSLSTNGASGADVWTGAATTVVINGGTYNEVFVNTNSSNVETVTISGGAKIEELAICVSYKSDGSTNIPNLTIDNATVTTLTTEEGNPIPENGITFQNGGTITNMPATEVAKILNETKTKAFATLEEALETATAEQTITLLADVTIATLDVINGKLIDTNGHNVTVTLFTLIDGAVANIPFDFVATTAKYERSVGSNAWGTICVPFTLKFNSDDYTLYEVESISTSTLTVSEVSGDVAPGKPVIFKKNGEAANVTFTTTDANVVDGAPKSGTHLVGTYESTKLTSPLENIYFINGDAFHQAKASLTVPAYRAYISYTVSGAKPSVLNLHIAGNEADGIEAVMLDELNTAAFYDANGRQLPAPQKGMNIMKLANGKTMKLILK